MVKDVRIIVPQSRPSDSRYSGALMIERATSPRKCRSNLASHGDIEESQELPSSDDEDDQSLRSNTDTENDEDCDYCSNEQGGDDDDNIMSDNPQYDADDRPQTRARSTSSNTSSMPERRRVKKPRRRQHHHTTVNLSRPTSQCFTPLKEYQVGRIIDRIPITGYLTFRESSDGNRTYLIDFGQGLSASPTLRNESFVPGLPGSSSRPRSQLNLEEHVQNEASTRSGYSVEEDDMLKQLKADGLQWKEIARHIPGRSPGALAVRYSTKFAARRPSTSRRRK